MNPPEISTSRWVRWRCARRGHPLALRWQGIDGTDLAWCTCGAPIDDPELAGLPPRVRRRVHRFRGDR